jgi:hypothetical protein
MEEVKPQAPVQAPILGTEMAQNLVKKMPGSDKKKKLYFGLLIAAIVLAGIGAGYLLSGKKFSTPKSITSTESGGKEAGIADTATFKDTATGTLEEGGVAGEGTHHLVRTGGASQTVYLTSTVIDLESFVGKNVQVWGQTISARKAGWLMDVGKVKVTE